MDMIDVPPVSQQTQSSVVPTYVLQPIERARTRVEQEQAEVTAERRAFEQFADRVTAIERTASDSPPVGDRTLIVTRETPAPMPQIRQAYRETVMAVDHYDREYGESFRSNLRAEFGPEITTAVCEGSAHLFTPQFKEALDTAAQQAQHDRADLLDTLDEEATSLTEAHETLHHLVTRLEYYTHRGSKTVHSQHGKAITGRLETLVEDRQQLLHMRSQPSLLTGRDVCNYLYHDEPWTYPVLRAAAVLRDLIETRQQ